VQARGRRAGAEAEKSGRKKCFEFRKKRTLDGLKVYLRPPWTMHVAIFCVRENEWSREDKACTRAERHEEIRLRREAMGFFF
jgi:hypothetical protein